MLRFTPTASANRVPGRGYGAVLVHPRKRAEISGGFRKTANNRMELFAAIAGLELLKQPCKVTLFFRKLAGIVQDAIYELLGQRPAIDKSPRILQKWVMKPKTELRKREHRLLKGHATI